MYVRMFVSIHFFTLFSNASASAHPCLSPPLAYLSAACDTTAENGCCIELSYLHHYPARGSYIPLMGYETRIRKVQRRWNEEERRKRRRRTTTKKKKTARDLANSKRQSIYLFPHWKSNTLIRQNITFFGISRG